MIDLLVSVTVTVTIVIINVIIITHINLIMILITSPCPYVQVLRIESMHYGALSGKGLMLMKLGRYRNEKR